jgi:hypothetical protein
MPAEEVIGLTNVERLFPTANRPCKQDHEQPTRLRTGWSFDLTAEDDELLAEHRIFGDELRLGAK